MMINTKLLNTISPSKEQFEEIIEICSSQNVVKNEVIKNHDNNLWWPVSVKDWRIRMLISGLSTRVSYRMIHTYQKVMAEIDTYSFERINDMSDEEFKKIVKPIGLSQNRVSFKNSLFEFINNLTDENIDINHLTNEELIYLIEERVKGAGYKVAQCCVLYSRGYYCGVMPVDSGMKDKQGVCLGFSYPKSPKGHEIHRKQLEYLTKKINFRDIAQKNGYDSLNFPNSQELSWWTHLVLIYYKRFFCNKNSCETCPLRKSKRLNIGKMCLKINPEKGGSQLIIVEGIDGVGKSTLVKKFEKFGYKSLHFPHKENVEDLAKYYLDIIEANKGKKIILDRSFVSEVVYGNVIRGKSRISKEDLNYIVNSIKDLNPLFLFLHGTKEELLNRKLEKKDVQIIEDHYAPLSNEYRKVFLQLEEDSNAIWIDTKGDQLNQFDILLNKFINRD